MHFYSCCTSQSITGYATHNRRSLHRVWLCQTDSQSVILLMHSHLTLYVPYLNCPSIQRNTFLHSRNNGMAHRCETGCVGYAMWLVRTANTVRCPSSPPASSSSLASPPVSLTLKSIHSAVATECPQQNAVIQTESNKQRRPSPTFHPLTRRLVVRFAGFVSVRIYDWPFCSDWPVTINSYLLLFQFSAD